MTRHMHNPFEYREGASYYCISTEIFFCLLQLYDDFSKQRAGFDLTIYYDLYLQISENKRILSALLTPKESLTQYLDAYRFDYDIVRQQQIVDAKDEIWTLPLSTHTWKDHDSFNDLIVPATLLKHWYLTYKTFVLKNKSGLALRWQGYSVAFLGDEPLMAVAVYPGCYQNDRMNGDLAGLEGYVISDLEHDSTLRSNVQIWGMLKKPRNEQEVIDRKKQNKRLNKKLRKQSRSL